MSQASHMDLGAHRSLPTCASAVLMNARRKTASLISTHSLAYCSASSSSYRAVATAKHDAAPSDHTSATCQHDATTNVGLVAQVSAASMAARRLLLLPVWGCGAGCRPICRSRTSQGKERRHHHQYCQRYSQVSLASLCCSVLVASSSLRADLESPCSQGRGGWERTGSFLAGGGKTRQPGI